MDPPAASSYAYYVVPQERHQRVINNTPQEDVILFRIVAGLFSSSPSSLSFSMTHSFPPTDVRYSQKRCGGGCCCLLTFVLLLSFFTWPRAPTFSYQVQV